jgi:ribonuclease HI
LQCPANVTAVFQRAGDLPEARCLLERALWPAPQGIRPPMQSDEVGWSGEHDGVIPSGDVYLDGSAYESTHQRCASVGWAAVALKEGCNDMAMAINGTMVGAHVDVNGGELTALIMLLKHSAAPVTAVVDSKFVYDGLTREGPERTTKHNYAWAHLWREVWRLLDDYGGLCESGLTVRWVKAHCTEAMVARGVISRRDFVGNKIADEAAKAAAGRCRIPIEDRSLLLRADLMVEGVGQWVSTVGALVEGKDTVHHKGRARRPAATQRDAVGVKLAHVWRGAPGSRWCEVCRWTEHKSECPGSVEASALEINAALEIKGQATHSLVRIEAANDEDLVKDMPVVACLVCGATGTQKAFGFKQSCGPPKDRGRAVLSRLDKHLAPIIPKKVCVNTIKIG